LSKAYLLHGSDVAVGGGLSAGAEGSPHVSVLSSARVDTPLRPWSNVDAHVHELPLSGPQCDQ